MSDRALRCCLVVFAHGLAQATAPAAGGAPAVLTLDGLVFDGQHPDTRPGGVPQTLVSFGATAESPDGWVAPGGQLTIGNNCHAREDWDGDAPTLGRAADGGPSREFRFAFQDSWELLGDYRTDADAAIVNAFYWVNVWHDWSYRLGFDEAAGNCQASNFGRGGLEGDPVVIEVQDGALRGTYNSISVRPAADGASPLLQIHLFQPPGSSQRIDPAFDADLILSLLNLVLVDRLVGSTGCFGTAESQALRSGVADYLAADYFGNPVLGEYSSGDAVKGRRDHPLDSSPLTYCDLCPGCPAIDNGLIAGAALWRMRQSIPPATIRQLVVDALEALPCGPTFLDLREAMVESDRVRHAGANRCAILAAWRDFGLGLEAASGTCDPSFLPPDCSGEAYLRTLALRTREGPGSNGDGLYAPGETVEADLDLQNVIGGSTANGVLVTLRSLTPGVTPAVPAQTYPDILPGSSATNQGPFQLALGPDYLCGGSIELEAEIAWSAPPRTRRERLRIADPGADSVVLFADGAESAQVWTTGFGVGVSTRQNHTSGGTRSYYFQEACWTANDPGPGCTGACNDLCASLTSPPLWLPTGDAAYLEFWATYNLEDRFDGLMVEISTDGGARFIALPFAGAGQIGDEPSSGCNMPRVAPAITGPPGNTGLAPWTRFRIELSAWAGQLVTLRLRQHNDPCVHYEGAFVDDLGVVIARCQDAPFAKLHALERSLSDDGDPACTDGDGQLDPGETARFAVTLVNIGTADAPAAGATLDTSSPHLLGLPATQGLGDLPSGARTPAAFTFQVAPLPGVPCFAPAEVSLAYTSAAPSTNRESQGFELRGEGSVQAWVDGFEGTQPAWTPSLGPDGMAQDWGLRELQCLSASGNRWFWATQQGIDRTVCATGEPDYSPDSDSVLTSPLIDLGTSRSRLVELEWATFQIACAMEDGFAQVLLDHDGDGTFTPVATAIGGFGLPGSTEFIRIDLTDPPDGTPFPPADTARFVRLQFRFRSLLPDPGPDTASVGWIVNDVKLRYRRCPGTTCSGCDPVPAFAGARAVVDPDLCAASGLEVRWDPAPFGPAGGAYDVYRDGRLVAAGLGSSPYLDTPGDRAVHAYRVLALTGDCALDDGNIARIQAADDLPPPPVPLGNVLYLVRDPGGTRLAWTDAPPADGYEAAASDSRDFAAPPAVVGQTPSGSPGLIDAAPLAAGAIRSYRVATMLCGATSTY